MSSIDLVSASDDVHRFSSQVLYECADGSPLSVLGSSLLAQSLEGFWLDHLLWLSVLRTAMSIKKTCLNLLNTFSGLHVSLALYATPTSWEFCPGGSSSE